MKSWKKLIAVLCAGVAGGMAHGETVVTLPDGEGEHFTVQTAAEVPLLRTDAGAVLTGSEVALGTTGDRLAFIITNRVVMEFIPSSIQETLVVGSNSADMATASILMGYSNALFLAPHCSILGGANNAVRYGGESLQPYYSVIGGGFGNVVSGAQNAVISGGYGNTASSTWAAVAGGALNTAGGQGAFAAGGSYNRAAGSHSLAGGYHAQAEHAGAFVWADHSTNVPFVSSNDNEFAVRASGGVRFESELGPDPLPNRKSRYGDNNIVAWAHVAGTGGIGSSHFGVQSCTGFGEGNYEILLDVPMSSPATLIPVATVDLFGMALPTNAASARLIYVERTLEPNRFIVRTTTGDYVPTNTAFHFIVTGR